MAVDHDDVVDVGDPSVAQNLGAAAHQVVVADVADLHLLALGREREWSQLEKAELRPLAVGREVARELDLHRPAGALGAAVEQNAEDLG